MKRIGERGARLFFAVDLDRPAQDIVAAWSAKRLRPLSCADVRWIAPENFHVTLRFLGKTPIARVPDLVRAVSEVSSSESRFEARGGSVRAFPSRRRARVLALGVTPEKRFAALAKAVDRGLETRGVEPEARPYRAHLTLGRFRSPQAWRLEVDPPVLSFSVDALALFESQLSKHGSTYHVIERIPLGVA